MVTRHERGQTVCARGSARALACGPSTSPLDRADMLPRLILLVCLATPVCAADFRIFNVGDTCARAEEERKPLGSIFVPWRQMSNAHIHAFQVLEYDRHLGITYSCRKDDFFTVDYSFPTERFDAAMKTHRHTDGRSVSTYGSPALDPSPSLVGTDVESLIGGPDRTKYSAAWWTSRASIMISIMPNQPWEVRGWRTFVVVGQTAK